MLFSVVVFAIDKFKFVLFVLFEFCWLKDFDLDLLLERFDKELGIFRWVRTTCSCLWPGEIKPRSHCLHA